VSRSSQGLWGADRDFGDDRRGSHGGRLGGDRRRRCVGGILGCLGCGLHGGIVDFDRNDLGDEIVWPTRGEIDRGGGFADDLLTGFASDHKAEFFAGGILNAFRGFESVNLGLKFVGGLLDGVELRLPTIDFGALSEP
jgi:hypothetical protein